MPSLPASPAEPTPRPEVASLRAVTEKSSVVAIVGTGRNGSTLIGRLLDGSPDMWVHPLELNYLAVWDELARRGTVSAPTVQNRTTRALTGLDREVARDALLGIFEPQWSEIERDYVARLVPQDRFEPGHAAMEGAAWSASSFLPAFLDTARRAYGGSGNESLLAFKTIETPYVDDYARTLPDIRFIHILRDPVTTYESLKRTRMQHKHQPFYADGDHLQTLLSARWLPHAHAILRGLETAPDRHLLVRYEDLRANPGDVIGSICAWLGVRPPAEPDRQTALGGRHLAELPSYPSIPGISTPEQVVPDMATRYAYDDVLTTRERELIVRSTAPLAERLGYPSQASTGVSLWMRWLLPDADERQHRGSRLRWAWEVLRRRAYITGLLLRSTGKAAA
jgi:hypothetical protein